MSGGPGGIPPPAGRDSVNHLRRCDSVIRFVTFFSSSSGLSYLFRIPLFASSPPPIFFSLFFPRFLKDCQQTGDSILLFTFSISPEDCLICCSIFLHLGGAHCLVWRHLTSLFLTYACAIASGIPRASGLTTFRTLYLHIDLQHEH